MEPVTNTVVATTNAPRMTANPAAQLTPGERGSGQSGRVQQGGMGKQVPVQLGAHPQGVQVPGGSNVAASGSEVRMHSLVSMFTTNSSVMSVPVFLLLKDSLGRGSFSCPSKQQTKHGLELGRQTPTLLPPHTPLASLTWQRS